MLPSDAEGNGTVAAILAVSCLPGEHCVAVGNYLDGDGNQRALVENLSAGSWTPSEAPLPSGITVDPSGSLSGVSCSISTAGAAPTATTTLPTEHDHHHYHPHNLIDLDLDTDDGQHLHSTTTTPPSTTTTTTTTPPRPRRRRAP